ncbi:MAG: DNA-binding protein WhiA [Clostridiaceae bacterium]
MSYSAKVKSEIVREENITADEFSSLLSAVMKVAGVLSLSSGGREGFRISTENASTARFLLKNIKQQLKMNATTIVSRSQSFKKNNLYIINFEDNDNMREFLIEMGILAEEEGGITLNVSIPKKLISSDLKKKAYIRGAFLGSGSMTDPEKQYHLEFVTHSEEYAQELMKLLGTYNLNAKVIPRKGIYVVYIKEGEQIVDVLNILGAHNALLETENVRIIKDMRNNVNRLVNCETANLSKTVNASVRQTEAIKLIEKTTGLSRLPDQLREIAELRLANPGISLKELGDMLDPKVGKSGVNHRLRKIEKFAEELGREGK